MKTRVVHCKRDAYDIYIGRPSPFGNPFSHKPGTLAQFQVATRDEAIARYEQWLPTQPAVLARLRGLKGKTLGCWCAPPGGVTAADPLICHGQVLARLADALDPEEVGAWSSRSFGDCSAF